MIFAGRRQSNFSRFGAMSPDKKKARLDGRAFLRIGQRCVDQDRYSAPAARTVTVAVVPAFPVFTAEARAADPGADRAAGNGADRTCYNGAGAGANRGAGQCALLGLCGRARSNQGGADSTHHQKLAHRRILHWPGRSGRYSGSDADYRALSLRNRSRRAPGCSALAGATHYEVVAMHNLRTALETKDHFDVGGRAADHLHGVA